MKEVNHDDDDDNQATKKANTPSSSSFNSNRKPKTIDTPTPFKKLNYRQHKSIKRNLSSAFTPITEDGDDALSPSEKKEPVDVHQSTVEIGKSSLLSDHDPISENAVRLQQPIEIFSVGEALVSKEDQITESVENYIVSSKQYISPASTTSGLGESSPSSSSSTSQITAKAAAAFVDSVPNDGATTEDMNSFNVQSWVKDLRESMCQVLNSDDLDPNYKKLFDALVRVVQIEELHSVHEEKDTMVVLLCFVLAAIVAGLVGFLLFLDAQCSYYGPPPT